MSPVGRLPLRVLHEVLGLRRRTARALEEVGLGGGEVPREGSLHFEQEFAVRHLLPGPRRRVPWRWIVQSPADFALPINMASIAEVRLATLRRTSAVTLAGTRVEARTLCALFGRGCEPLAHPRRTWRLEAVALVLHRIRDEVEGDPGLHGFTSQSAFSRQLRETSGRFSRRHCCAIGWPAGRSETPLRPSRGFCPLGLGRC